eukprot:33424-Prorocentrum_minimum.AAC.1
MRLGMELNERRIRSDSDGDIWSAARQTATMKIGQELQNKAGGADDAKTSNAEYTDEKKEGEEKKDEEKK